MSKVFTMEFGIWDRHVEDLLHDFGCKEQLEDVVQELAKMNLNTPEEYLRYEIVAFAIEAGEDGDVTAIADLRIDPEWLNYLKK